MFVTGYRKYSALSGGMWKVESGILNKGIDFFIYGPAWKWHENSISCGPFHSDWLRVYCVSAVSSDWLRGISEVDDRLWLIFGLEGKDTLFGAEQRIDICNFIRYYLKHCNFIHIHSFFWNRFLHTQHCEFLVDFWMRSKNVKFLR